MKLTTPTTPANKWPEKREALLRQHYSTMPWPELCALLNDTQRAIYNKASRMGLSRNSKPPTEAQTFSLSGPKVIREELAVAPDSVPIRNSTVRSAFSDPYSAPELRHSTRPGAMDAHKIPSRYLPNPPALKKGSSE